ncbi:MAG: 50S ribosomal protein L6 [Oscillospiraceae bacterium]|jgi:large subunit ribosomal protein L6|nr:50S ribosomal protein L6 [Oscillospiraceae bacterium]
MSRIGRKPIDVPSGVEVSFLNKTFKVKGEKGELSQIIHQNMQIDIDGNKISVSRLNDEKFNRSLHGLTRSLIANMVEGVKKGFEKTLEINGVGYRAKKQGNDLIMNLGFSHPVVVSEIEGISIDVPAANRIIVRGADKQKVGQFAAEIRMKRPPEPYKGKGIKYNYEVIRRKEGKAGKSAKK